MIVLQRLLAALSPWPVSISEPMHAGIMADQHQPFGLDAIRTILRSCAGSAP